MSEPLIERGSDLPTRLSSTQTVRHHAREFFREHTIDSRGLPGLIPVLAVFGYLCVFAMLAGTLVFEVIGDQLPSVRLDLGQSSDFENTHVPVAVMYVSSAAFMLGWAFLLTGATDCGRRVLAPIGLVFALQLMLLGSASEIGAVILILGGLPFFLALMLFHGITHRRHYWRAFPLYELLLWSVVMLGFLGVTWGLADSLEHVAEALRLSFSLVHLLSLAYWFAAGLDLMDGAVHVAHLVTIRTRRRYRAGRLCSLVVALLVLRPVVATLLGLATRDPFWFIDAALGMVILVVMLGLVVSRRWHENTASLLLGLSLVSAVFAIGLSLAFEGADFLEFALEATGVFPHVFLFVSLLAYNVVQSGTRFANQDGKHIPRTGRVLMYLGASLLVISSALFFLNVRHAETGEMDLSYEQVIDALFALGAIVFGPPYLIWTIWRHRDRLIGDSNEFLAPAEKAQAESAA